MNKKTDFPDLSGEIHVIPDGVMPKWRPSAYAVVEVKREILMVRPHWSKLWDLPGGEVDPGETLEEAAIREGRQEAARQLVLNKSMDANGPTPFYFYEGNLFYRDKRDPENIVDNYWHVLAYFFHAVLASDEVDESMLGAHEIEEVRWVTIEDMFVPPSDPAYVPVRPFHLEALKRGVWRHLQASGGWRD